MHSLNEIFTLRRVTFSFDMIGSPSTKLSASRSVLRPILSSLMAFVLHRRRVGKKKLNDTLALSRKTRLPLLLSSVVGCSSVPRELISLYFLTVLELPSQNVA